jgi:U3 small nucleolar RNA-associated protein 7
MIIDKRFRQIDDELDDKTLKYARGSVDFNTKNTKHKALRKTLESLKSNIKKSAVLTSITEILLPQEPGYIEVDELSKIYELKQTDIQKNVDLNTSSNLFDFQLTKFGPYILSYSRNGRNLLFGGKRGHIASIDCLRTNVSMELQLQETVHDVCYLHNDTIFAAAQKNFT